MFPHTLRAHHVIIAQRDVTASVGSDAGASYGTDTGQEDPPAGRTRELAVVDRASLSLRLNCVLRHLQVPAEPWSCVLSTLTGQPAVADQRIWCLPRRLAAFSRNESQLAHSVTRRSHHSQVEHFSVKFGDPSYIVFWRNGCRLAAVIAIYILIKTKGQQGHLHCSTEHK